MRNRNTKTCSRCQRNLAINRFGTSDKNKSGISGICKKCEGKPTSAAKSSTKEKSNDFCGNWLQDFEYV